jgi:lipopolysaccharide export system protein LptC
MTQAADLIRDKRRLWAAPGGSHDRMVRSLARWLPGLVGVVAAAMIVGPLFPKGEISFLLDRNKVAMTGERVRVYDAMYRGEDDKGRPFTDRQHALSRGADPDGGWPRPADRGGRRL